MEHTETDGQINGETASYLEGWTNRLGNGQIDRLVDKTDRLMDKTDTQMGRRTLGKRDNTKSHHPSSRPILWLSSVSQDLLHLRLRLWIPKSFPVLFPFYVCKKTR